MQGRPESIIRLGIMAMRTRCMWPTLSCYRAVDMHFAETGLVALRVNG